MIVCGLQSHSSGAARFLARVICTSSTQSKVVSGLSGSKFSWISRYFSVCLWLTAFLCQPVKVADDTAYEILILDAFEKLKRNI